MGDGAQKSEKPKSNLAAAKAQELFGIFYSSIGQSGTSSITKPATDDRANDSSTNKSQLANPPAQKVQPQRQLLTQSQPPTVVCTSLQPDSNNSPSPQTQPESDIQITYIWSLQSTAASTPEVTPSETTSPTTQPKLNPPAQSEAQRSPPNQSSTPKSESQITPQTKPVDLEPIPQTQSQPKLTPQNQSEPQSEPQPDQDTQPPSHPLSQAVTSPESVPKPAPKTRGKTTPTKRTPPAPRPVRQTRSQTRYQTRQQQQNQSESEPEPASGDSNSVASDPKGLDTSDLSSGSNPEDGVPNEGEPQMMEITPETLGLPSSLDFETDFNFE